MNTMEIAEIAELIEMLRCLPVDMRNAISFMANGALWVADKTAYAT